MTVCICDLSEKGEAEAEWDEFVRRSGASIYHFANWRHLIKDVFGHDSYYLYARNNANEIIGILPLIRLKSFLFGDFLVSMPYFNYGGIAALSVEVEEKLYLAAEKLRGNLGCSFVEMREHKPRENKLPVRTDKVTTLLKLPAEVEELWGKIGAKRRSQIKRPIREGVEYIYGGRELLNEFYRVFSINMRDLGTPVYSKYFFNSIMDWFPENASIAIVKLHKQVVGAGFLLGHGETLEIPWASTIRKYNSLGINMYMYWNILKTAIEKKYRIFDFGRSSKEAGTLKFKKQWGGQEEQLYWYYLLRNDAALPRLNPNNPKFKFAINLWQKLPVPLANIVGPSIVKNLP